MYYTRYVGSTGGSIILKAGMDGSEPTSLVRGSGDADGIDIDLQSKRIYWAEFYNNRIGSSNLHGGDMFTVALNTSGPYGIAIVGERVWWGHPWSGVVQSVSKSGSGIRTEFTAQYNTRQFVVPNWEPLTTRQNHCDQQICLGICVLSPNSFRCLP